MTRFKLSIEYDGEGIAGWQRQPDAHSVQGHLETAAQKLCGSFCEVIGAGRTDAGVHAARQIAHVDIEKTMDAYNVLHGLNYHLSAITAQIIVTGAYPVSNDFHARFSAIGRIYQYRIINRRVRPALDRGRAWHIPEKLDAQAMHAAAQSLVGTHDFTTFRSSICQAKSPVKTLDQLDITQSGEQLLIYVAARSFLHHQVRNMVGTLRFIGNGKWTLTDLQRALHACDRCSGGETAPPQGLCLMDVLYE